jgi:hypothetical protein
MTIRTLFPSLAVVTYVLRTGALWMESIDSADITVDSSYRKVTFSIPPHQEKPGQAIWHFKDFEPDQDLIMTIQQE